MRGRTDALARDGLSNLLREELTVGPARWRHMLRITACTVLMVAIAMTFRIPLPAYAAYLVFMVSQADAAATLLTATGGAVSVTLAVGLSILLYVFDAGEPALRLPLLALSAFLGSFLSRTSALGPIAFLSGYILVLTQTLLDGSPATEPIVHSVLWLWVVVVAPVTVTVAVTLLTGESPVTLARKRARSAIEGLAAYLEHPRAHDPARLREQLVALEQLKNRALGWNKNLKVFAQEDGAMLALLLEILEISRALPPDTPLERRQYFAASVRAAGDHLLTRRSGRPDATSIAPVAALPAPSEACSEALQRAIDELLHRAQGHDAKAPPPSPQKAHAFLVADAFRNRAHARFAFKVTLAVLASYATYTLLDWPGIRTAVTTCFFVSLTTFGESLHKFTLRTTGALIGGLLAGLCLVFVLPMLTGIGQLSLVIGAAALFSAWIATSSEAISYAGLQIAFAFFLGVLQGYGPASDLTVLRDRVVGILIGNVWVTLIFASLWPVSAASEIRRLQEAVFKQLGALLRPGNSEISTADKLQLGEQLGHAELLRARGAFEWRVIDAARAPVSAQVIDRVTARALILLRLREAIGTSTAGSQHDAQLAGQLLALAGRRSFAGATTRTDNHAPEVLIQARQQLQEELDHALRSS